MIDNPHEQAEAIESSLDRFREHSFFADECMDLLVAVQEDPIQQAVFKRLGYRREWLDDILHQRKVLEQMSTLLLNWETVRESRDQNQAPAA